MKFLHQTPALLYKDNLIIGDTHFGIESRFQQKGIFLNDFSIRMAERIISVSREYKVNNLIFLGDVKENIQYVDSITQLVFEKLRKEKFNISIVRGNHDGGIEKLGVTIHPSSGYILDNLALVHGHSWPADSAFNTDYIISAHQHPQIELTDSLGKKYREPVWLIIPPDKKHVSEFYEKFNSDIKLVIMPAFNELVGSSLKSLSTEQLGPLLTNGLFKWKNAEVHNLGGICLGNLKTLSY